MIPSQTSLENDINNAIASDADLSALNSSSSTSNFKVWAKLAAAIHLLVYQLVDGMKTEIAAIAASQVWGTRDWYAQIVNTWAINNSITLLRISVRENAPTAWPSTVVIKLAQDDGNGRTINLNDTDLTSCRDYITKNKVAGVNVMVVSQPADQVDVSLDIRYVGTKSTVEAAINAAILTYLNTMAFDTSLSKTLLESYLITTVTGVKDAVITSLTVNGVIVANNTIESESGYFEIGQNAGTDLINLNMYV